MTDSNPLNDRPFPEADPNSVEDPKILEDTSLALFDAEDMDRFELLSAYLDGEVTADERRQVQQWLDTDPKVQKWYRQLTKFQQSVKYVRFTADSPTAACLTAQVLRKLDRQRNHRLLMMGGALMSAIAVGLAIHLSLERDAVTPQMAQNPPIVGETDGEALVIALNYPLFDLSDGRLKDEKH